MTEENVLSPGAIADEEMLAAGYGIVSANGQRPMATNTDVGNAARLVATHGADIRYVARWGWHVWDGKRWARDDLGRVYELAKEVARSVYCEAAREDDATERKSLAAWARQSENAARIRAMVELARTDPAVAVLPEAMDADPWLLTAANGTVDLRTGDLAPHRRPDLITKLAPAAYEPDARAPVWDAFLERTVPDEEVRTYLRRLAGCALPGVVVEHVLGFCYGTGANGKTTFLRALLHVFGDYARQADAALLLESRHAEHPTAVARLVGARLVACVEAGAGRRLAEVMVKTLTGGDRVAARFMHQDYFEFDPTWTVLLAANHKPVVKGTDHAIWRRIHLIPFTVTISPEEQDRDLAAKLEAEAPGILAWAVRGCLE
jgi:putative DNA primase/helicase